MEISRANNSERKANPAFITNTNVIRVGKMDNKYKNRITGITYPLCNMVAMYFHLIIFKILFLVYNSI